MTTRVQRNILAEQCAVGYHLWTAFLLVGALSALPGCTPRYASEETDSSPNGVGEATAEQSPETLAEGKRTFRFETFGNEQFWTDGWSNRHLNVGAIIALSPAVTAAQKAIYNSWGPGKYDPRYNLDGKSTVSRHHSHRMVVSMSPRPNADARCSTRAALAVTLAL